MENNIKTFSTDSFNLASFLLSQSCRLVNLDRTNPKRIIFIFEDTSERAALTEMFLMSKAQIEPNRFIAAQKNLKQLIYQNQ